MAPSVAHITRIGPKAFAKVHIIFQFPNPRATFFQIILPAHVFDTPVVMRFLIFAPGRSEENRVGVLGIIYCDFRPYNLVEKAGERRYFEVEN